jgi:hypothetical protein
MKVRGVFLQAVVIGGECEVRRQVRDSAIECELGPLKTPSKIYLYRSLSVSCARALRDGIEADREPRAADLLPHRCSAFQSPLQGAFVPCRYY